MGIGVQRGATGWVFRHLIQHPDVWMPPLKELHHFDVIDPVLARKPYRYGQNLKRRIAGAAAGLVPSLVPASYRARVFARWDLSWDLRYFTGRTDMDWYRALFARAASQGKVTGEITPEYCMLTDELVQGIAAAFPDLRPFLILRDPIDRSWSNFQLVVRHSARTSQVNDATREARFHTFLNQNENHVLDRLDYARSISTWRAAFPGESLLVTTFDQMRNDPDGFLAAICNHIGIDPTKVLADPGLRINSHRTRIGRELPNYAETALAERALPHLRLLAETVTDPAVKADVQKWTARAEAFV